MKKSLYIGLMAAGLVGIIGCDSEERKIINTRIQEAKRAIPVTHYNHYNTGASLAIATEDMNGDKRPDIIVTANEYTSNVAWGTAGIYVFLNNGDGTYTSQTPSVKAEVDEEDFKKKNIK